VLVIAENLLRGAPIAIRQGRTPPADFQDLRGKTTPAAVAPNPEEPFFGCRADRRRDGFPRERRKLAHGLFRGRVLDVERHKGHLGRFFLPGKITPLAPSAKVLIASNRWRISRSRGLGQEIAERGAARAQAVVDDYEAIYDCIPYWLAELKARRNGAPAA